MSDYSRVRLVVVFLLLVAISVFIHSVYNLGYDHGQQARDKVWCEALAHNGIKIEPCEFKRDK